MARGIDQETADEMARQEIFLEWQLSVAKQIEKLQDKIYAKRVGFKMRY